MADKYKYINLALTFSMLCICIFASGQQGQFPADERSFDAINSYYQELMEEHPDRRGNKLIQRQLHQMKMHLSEEGEVVNQMAANMQALEELYIDTFPGTIQGDWQPIGPVDIVGSDLHSSEGIGRVNCVEFATQLTWYAGTAGGGLWRTDLAGIHIPGGDYPWYPLTDNIPGMAISGISVHPDDPDDLFILTGDGEVFSIGSVNDRGSQSGIGILHSEDGGATWTPTSLQYGMAVQNSGYKLVRYPGSVDTMFAACTDSLFRTVDGWQSHVGIVGVTCYDVEFKPGDPQTVYAAFQGSLRRSTDGGASFSDITSNLQGAPLSDMGRMEIAVSPDNPSILYVVIAESSDGGLLSCQYSLDGGNTFLETTDNDFNILAGRDPIDDRDGQGNYDLAIWSNPTDAETVIVGGVNVWKSAAFGLSWFKIADWQDSPPDYVHADIHDLVTNPFNGDIVVCTDGGIYASSDGGENWENRSRGLGIMQYYHLDVYTEFLGLPILGGGTQDNGTNAGAGFTEQVFTDIKGGDGFRYYRGAYDGNAVRYGSVQNGKLFRQTYTVLDIWDDDNIIPDDQEAEDGDGMGAWDTPYQPNPNAFNELLAGYNRMYYYNGSWGSIDFPAGFTYGSSNLILELEWSPSNTNVVYFYTQDGSERDLYKVEQLFLGVLQGQFDGPTTTVVSLDDVASMPTGDYSDIADIFINPNNDTAVWVTFYSYFSGRKVFYNQNMAADSAWYNISYNLPNVPVHCGVWDIDGIYVGTDIGVFFLPHGESSWIYFSEGLPTTAVTELRIENTILGRKIFASTYGRGIWYSTPAETPRRTRWYVYATAGGLNNGSSWANAFTDLQDAFDIALPGDSVWIAESTYFPGSVNGFSIASSDVRVFGGFLAGDTSMMQRDLDSNHTILSGDIGIVDDSTDNAWHVIRLTDQNSGVLLDGLEIVDGNADGTGLNSYGGGVLLTSYNGGTMPIISNCRVENNTASQFGGGIYIGNFNMNGIPMKLRKCRMSHNYAGGSGGAIYIDAFSNFFPFDTGAAVVYLDTCAIDSNKAFLEGGGMFIEGVNASTAIVKFDSAQFTSNRIVLQGRKGGAVHANLGTGSSLTMDLDRAVFTDHNTGGNSFGGSVYVNGAGANSTLNFISSTIGNSKAAAGGGIFIDLPNSQSTAQVTLDACHFEQDSAGFGGAMYLNCRNRAQLTIVVQNTDFHHNKASSRGGAIHFDGDTGGKLTIGIDSCNFEDNTANENAAIRFLSRTTSGEMAQMAIDISNSSFVSNISGPATDGGAIGINADWAGVDASIVNTLFENNFTGNRGGAVMHSQTGFPDTSYLSVTYDNCTFTGNSTLFAGASTGGALSFLSCDPTILHCDFINNESLSGGAIHNRADFFPRSFNYTIDDCQFISNRAQNNGGAVYNDHNTPSLMTVQVLSSVFDSNYTTSTFSGSGRGGAIYTFGDGRIVQEISNSHFVDNVASRDGGAIDLTNFAVVDTLLTMVDSCTFVNNTANGTGETVQQAGIGNGAMIYSKWSNSNFYTADPDVVFNNLNIAAGQSIVRIRDCYIYHGLPEGISALPVPIQMGSVRTIQGAMDNER